MFLIGNQFFLWVDTLGKPVMYRKKSGHLKTSSRLGSQLYDPLGDLNANMQLLLGYLTKLEEMDVGDVWL